MFKPMLAPQDDPLKRPTFFQDLPLPLLVSNKIDGIRGVPVPGYGVLSRTLKKLRSNQLQKNYGGHAFLDSEFTEGDPATPDCYNRSSSHIMSADKPGDLFMFVFDWADPEDAELPFYKRLEIARKEVDKINSPDVILLEHTEVNTLDELFIVENEALEAGYEGLMMRNPMGIYKHNRCTWNDNILYKLKRFADDEALIIGFEERLRNDNPLQRDERGYAKRTSHKENMVPSNTLGKFIVDYKGVTLTVAPGAFTHSQLKYIWDNKHKHLHKILKFRYFQYGKKDLPRFPRALGFRDSIDL